MKDISHLAAMNNYLEQCGKKSGYIFGLGVHKLPCHLQASTSNENDSALRNELRVQKDRTSSN